MNSNILKKHKTISFEILHKLQTVAHISGFPPGNWLVVVCASIFTNLISSLLQAQYFPTFEHTFGQEIIKLELIVL